MNSFPSWLTDLPVLGTLFHGSVAMVLLKLAALAAVSVVSIKLLSKFWGGGEKKISEKKLLKDGRFEEAGDFRARLSDYPGALEHYEQAEAWNKAGHAARRMGDHALAGKYFEEAGEFKLALASYEAAGDNSAIARLAPHTSDPSLLARAAAWHRGSGEHFQAAELFQRAGKLRDAEQSYLQSSSAEAGQRAYEMYRDAYRDRMASSITGKLTREYAARAVVLLVKAGQHPQAIQLFHEAELDAAELDSDVPELASAIRLAQSEAPGGPSGHPSGVPSRHPSGVPSRHPSGVPSRHPSGAPSQPPPAGDLALESPLASIGVGPATEAALDDRASGWEAQPGDDDLEAPLGSYEAMTDSTPPAPASEDYSLESPIASLDDLFDPSGSAQIPLGDVEPSSPEGAGEQRPSAVTATSDLDGGAGGAEDVILDTPPEHIKAHETAPAAGAMGQEPAEGANTEPDLETEENNNVVLAKIAIAPEAVKTNDSASHEEPRFRGAVSEEVLNGRSARRSWAARRQRKKAQSEPPDRAPTPEPPESVSEGAPPELAEEMSRQRYQPYSDRGDRDEIERAYGSPIPAPASFDDEEPEEPFDDDEPDVMITSSNASDLSVPIPTLDKRELDDDEQEMPLTSEVLDDAEEDEPSVGEGDNVVEALLSVLDRRKKPKGRGRETPPDRSPSGGYRPPAPGQLTPRSRSKDEEEEGEGRDSFGFSKDVTTRYAMLERIGTGGMGEVFKARDRSLGRIVALKFLSHGMVGDETAMRFFLREARAAAALNHPVIVTVYDIGVLDERPFICMEFVDGTDLATRLADEGALPVGHALNLAIQLALALDYAHQRNVVHRDIKPPNVIETVDGVVKILDFGLAKAIQGQTKKSTFVAGTPEYMSPEQLAGLEVDGRTDIFSLGVLLYEILTNQTPFKGALRSDEFTPVSQHAPWLPPGIDEALAGALTVRPEDRYQSGRELAVTLRRVLRGG